MQESVPRLFVSGTRLSGFEQSLLPDRPCHPAGGGKVTRLAFLVS
ncbi:MAG: hypothetical protein V3T54_05995 [Acidobacteriota bacterium]